MGSQHDLELPKIAHPRDAVVLMNRAVRCQSAGEFQADSRTMRFGTSRPLDEVLNEVHGILRGASWAVSVGGAQKGQLFATSPDGELRVLYSEADAQGHDGFATLIELFVLPGTRS